MDQETFDSFAMDMAEVQDEAPTRRRLLAKLAMAGIAVLGLQTVASKETDAASCRRRCRRKNRGNARRRCLRKCRGQDDGPEVGCSPPNNTQGSCPRGQICNNRSICVAGCTGTGQGTCPSGQSCINGQCV
jgi:hypothetical protein